MMARRVRAAYRIILAVRIPIARGVNRVSRQKAAEVGVVPSCAEKFQPGVAFRLISELPAVLRAAAPSAATVELNTERVVLFARADVIRSIRLRDIVLYAAVIKK